MKKVLVLIVSFTLALQCDAQIEVQVSQLEGTKWERVLLKIGDVVEYPKDNDVVTIAFSKDSLTYDLFYGHYRKSTIFSHPYYIATNKPSYDSFHFDNVGKNDKGCYIVKYNNVLNEIDYYEITSFTSNEMVLFHKGKPKAIPRRDVYIMYKRLQ